MPCPKCELEYGVMPQTYMRTRGGSIGRKSSFWPVSVLWILIGGSSTCRNSSAFVQGRVRVGAPANGDAPSDRCSAKRSRRLDYNRGGGERGDSLAAPDEADALVRGRLDRDGVGLEAERAGDPGAHLRHARPDPGPLGDDREVDVAGPAAAPTDDLDHADEQV